MIAPRTGFIGFLVVLLGLAASNLGILAQPSGIHRELYLNLDPAMSSLAALTNHPAFLGGAPDQSDTLTTAIETERNRGDDYGQRLRAFLIPPATGNYTFWIASDELSQLFLSTNENPANKRLVAWVDPRSQSRVWTTHAGQQSTNVSLQSGRRYYFEVLHKEGLLLDHLAVRWQMPGGTIEEPIPASRFIYELSPLIGASPTNLVVEEGRPATFSVALANFLPQQFQWQRSGTNVPGATNQCYTIPSARLADDGAPFRVWVTNSVGFTNSALATLTVRRDTNAPLLVNVVSASLTNVLLTFSEAVATNSALSPANYALTGVSITSATFGESGQIVELSTSPLAYESVYTLLLSNVLDRAALPNQITPTQFNFTARQFNAQGIGAPLPAGSVVSTNGGFIVTGGGSLAIGAADRLAFGWDARSGDFDLKVRLEEFDAADLWAVAGLMAREDLTESSRFAAVFATPSLAGCFFQTRTNTGWPSARSGSFPVNWPNTWLRLKRTDNVFTGFAGNDGERWSQLGSLTLNLPGRIYLGLAVASGQPGQSATARMRDFSSVTVNPPGPPSTDREPPGPSSRRTGLVLSELMYHPRDVFIGTNTAELEFVELFNSNPFYEDIGGFRITGDIEFTFPAGTILPGGGFMLVASSPADVQTVYGLAGVFGPFTGKLPNDSGESVCATTPATYCFKWTTHRSPRGPSPRMARGIRWCWPGLPMARTSAMRGPRATRWAGRRGAKTHSARIRSGPL